VEAEIENFRGHRESLIDNILRPLSEHYDLALLDTKPGGGWLVYNAMIAATDLITPCEPENFSVMGLIDLGRALATLSNQFHRKLQLKAIVPTRVNASRREHTAFLNSLRQTYGTLITATMIRQDANLARAQTQNRSILELDSKSRAALDYLALGKELHLWSTSH
jgi:chromosome partitioning protein